MTAVCFVTPPEQSPQEGLMAYETVRQALSPYDIDPVYENAITIDTVSLGSAVALLADLDWYLRRTVADVFVREPAVSDTEWLSRELAGQLREESSDPEATAGLVKIYGVDANRLVEPMYAERRHDGSIPAYDLREVDETVVVRVAASEFGQ